MSGIAGLPGDTKHAYRVPISFIFERLIKKFGYEAVAAHLPADDHKLLNYVRKALRRRERKKQNKRNGGQSKKNKNEDNVLDSSDDEEDAENDDERQKMLDVRLGEKKPVFIYFLFRLQMMKHILLNMEMNLWILWILNQ